MKNKIFTSLFLLIISFNLYASNKFFYIPDEIAKKNAGKISKIVYNSIAKTGENIVKAETIEKITYYVIGGLSNFVVSKYCSEELYKKVNQHIAALIEKGTFEATIKSSFKKGFKTHLMWVGGDIFVELVKQSILEHSRLRNNIKTSILWWIDIGYADLKLLLNPNKVAGSIDFVVGNTKVLAKMAVAINEELTKLGKAKWDLKYQKSMFELMSYKDDYLKKYSRSSTIENREKILDSFRKKILSYKLSGNIFGSGHKDVYNIKISGLQYYWIMEIENFERDKFNALDLMIYNKNKLNYDKYLNIYFTPSEKQFLKKYYAIGVHKKIPFLTDANRSAYKYAVKSSRYGFFLSYYNISKLSSHKVYKPIKKHIAYNLISKIPALYKEHSPLPPYTEKDLPGEIDRKNFLRYLYITLDLSSFLYPGVDEKIKNELKQNSININQWKYYSLVLNKLGILKGNPRLKNVREDDKLTAYEALAVVTRTLDFLKLKGKIH